MKTYKFIRKDLLFELYQFDLLSSKDNLSENGILIVNNLEEVDEIIESTLFNFTLSRLSFVDRAIIRIATYELKFTETATAIIINEAINLTKEFSDLDDERQHKFNNSLLDNIAKNVRG